MYCSNTQRVCFKDGVQIQEKTVSGTALKRNHCVSKSKSFSICQIYHPLVNERITKIFQVNHNLKKPHPMLSTLCESVQILTDIPGFFEN